MLLGGAAQHLMGQSSLGLLVARRRIQGALLRLVHATSDSCVLLLNDLSDALGQLLEDAVQVCARQLLGALLLQPLQDPAQAWHIAAALPEHAALHQALQGAPDVAFGHQVIRQRVEHVIGVKRWQGLAAVPG